uniref:Protein DETOXIFICATION n=1 Tax=Kalanchoe fedtschenkoi TaxID=63787 RepID=A0A7N0UWE9_KALFE
MDENGDVDHPCVTIPEQAIQSGNWGSGSKPICRKDVVAEAKLQLLLAGPMILVSLFVSGLEIVTLMFVGHLGVLALAGASLGYSFMSATGILVIMGMASALDTMCGQSYGAKEYRLVGIHMQRSVVVHLLTCAVLSGLWANTAAILKAAGQHPEIANAAGVYAMCLIPSVYGYAVLLSLVKFLQTQSIVFPMILISAFTFAFHICLCWVMVYRTSLGSRGAAMAMSISVWLAVLIHSLYVKFSPSCKKTWPGISIEALKSIKFHLRIAIPSALMVCLELWTFEIIVLLAGLLPNPNLETSVLSITCNTSTIFFLVSYGFGAAISTRVSNELGAGNPRAVRLAVFVVLGIYIVVGLMSSLVLVATWRVIGYAYTNDREVVAALAIMMLILSASNFLDGIQCILSGIVRGCGKQKMGAFCNLAAYYLVGLPSAVILAFVLHTGAKGLWLGMLIAVFVQTLCLLVATMLTDLQKEVPGSSG